MNIHSTEFLLQQGDEQWLKGVQYAPAKLQRLSEVNRILAHRPWLITTDHIQVTVPLLVWFQLFCGSSFLIPVSLSQHWCKGHKAMSSLMVHTASDSIFSQSTAFIVELCSVQFLLLNEYVMLCYATCLRPVCGGHIQVEGTYPIKPCCTLAKNWVASSVSHKWTHCLDTHDKQLQCYATPINEACCPTTHEANKPLRETVCVYG